MWYVYISDVSVIFVLHCDYMIYHAEDSTFHLHAHKEHAKFKYNALHLKCSRLETEHVSCRKELPKCQNSSETKQLILDCCLDKYKYYFYNMLDTLEGGAKPVVLTTFY